MPVPPKRPDQRRRRNVTGVKPDHNVPISGRKGPTPRCPLLIESSGRQFWRWVWHTPQACQFHDGFLIPLARLAQLHDEYDRADDEQARNRVGQRIEKGYIEFGLTPRAMSQLHLYVTDDDKADAPAEMTGVPDQSELDLRRRAKEQRTG